MAETINTVVAAAPDFGDYQPASPVRRARSNMSPRLTLPELEAISEALHAMRVGEIEADTPAQAETVRALLASADAKILAMREARLRRRAIDREIDEALIAIDAAMEACTDGSTITDRAPAFVV